MLTRNALKFLAGAAIAGITAGSAIADEHTTAPKEEATTEKAGCSGAGQCNSAHKDAMKATAGKAAKTTKKAAATKPAAATAPAKQGVTKPAAKTN